MKKNMNANVKMVMYVAVATCLGVLLAQVIKNTGVIEKVIPKRYEDYDDYDDYDEPVL